MRIFQMICLTTVAAAVLSACASGSGYGYNGDRYSSRSGTCERARSNDRLAGTVVGAGVGALAGSAIAGNSSNTEGAVVGGVAGAIIGNQLAKGSPCPAGYYRVR